MALQVTKPAPDFTADAVENGEFKQITLSSYRGAHVIHNGEVCPANWKPGEATMKPDPTGSKAYFATVK